jgi:hypothetical protein
LKEHSLDSIGTAVVVAVAVRKTSKRTASRSCLHLAAVAYWAAAAVTAESSRASMMTEKGKTRYHAACHWAASSAVDVMMMTTAALTLTSFDVALQTYCWASSCR